jgi:hypothetical protein
MRALLFAAIAVTLFAGPAGVPSVSIPAPKGAVIAVLIDVQALRTSPHRQHYAQIVRAMPDYVRVMGNSGEDPIDVYDRILVASANPRRLTDTVLVASTSRPEAEVIALLDKAAGETLAWERGTGGKHARPKTSWWANDKDPRVFMRSGKGSVAFAHPKHGKWYARAVKRGRKRGFPPRLQGAVLVAEVEDLGLRLGGGLPRPARARVALIDGVRPELRALLQFDTDEDAERFVAAWPRAQRELVQHWELAVLGYTALVARVEIERVAGGVLATVQVESKEVERLSRFLATTIKNRTRAHRRRP